MRRPAHWVFSALCLLSLLLCLGTAWLWVRSLRASNDGPDEPPYRPYPPLAGVIGTVPGRLLACVYCTGGDIHFLAVGPWPNAERPRYYSVRRGEESPAPELFPAPHSPPEVYWGGPVWNAGRCTRVAALDKEGRPVLLGPWVGGRVSGPLTLWSGRVPAWAVVGLFALLPLLRFTFRARHFYVLSRRRRLGFCRRCGYDLTANVSGVCPECGIAARAGTA